MLETILSLTYLQVYLVTSQQSWVTQPGYSEVNPGWSVILPCIVQNLTGDCRWSKEGTPVGIFTGKYEWAGRKDRGDCSLVVMDADEVYDSGGWQCAVTASTFLAGDALVSGVAELVVRRPPSGVQVRRVGGEKEEDIMIVVENTNITLECVSTGGLPQPRLFWNYTDLVTRITEDQDGEVSTLVATVNRSADLVVVKCSVGHDALEETMEAAVNISVECKLECLHESFWCIYLTEFQRSITLSCL